MGDALVGQYLTLASETVVDRATLAGGLDTGNPKLYVRPSTGGPEEELVDWFLQHARIHAPQGCRATVFRQPQLESGFPDLVIVVWDSRVSRYWGNRRAQLNSQDIRVLHLLASNGAASVDVLCSFLALRAKDVEASLKRLAACRAVTRGRKKCRLRSLKKTFAVRKIIAVEAKMHKWRKAIEQAMLDRWFSSQSYILLPRAVRSSTLLETARASNVGVWARNGTRVKREVTAPTHRLPQSYASWLFNEWVWRVAWQERRRRSNR